MRKLTKHASGKYCCKIDGKHFYFGKKGCTEAEAYEDYLRRRSTLDAKPLSANPTLREALDQFLLAKKAKYDRGKLSLRTYDEYRYQMGRVVKVVDKRLGSLTAADFTKLMESFEGKTPKTVQGYVTRSIVAFRWVEKQYGVKFDFGDEFQKPTAVEIRRHRNQQPLRLFEPEELRHLIKIAKPNMRAMILLGINCGFGNEDCATLKVSALELGWHNHPRPKTEIPRRCPLWPETEEALRQAEGGQDYVFLTRWRNPYSNGTAASPIANEFRKLPTERTFYDLRRTFQTVADDSLDIVAVKAIMGHIDGSMSGTYRQRVSDERLLKVSNVVRNWLYPEKAP